MNSSQQKVYDNLTGEQKKEVDSKIKDGYELYSHNPKLGTVVVQKGYTFYEIQRNGSCYQV